ncbi:MAG: type I DNA topoisomerase [Alphaproteobacteria bacterium]
MDVVIVESPAKTKTIEKYLGSGYKALASFGHIRDLPSKDGSVDVENGFAMKWATTAQSDKKIKDIIKAVKGADNLILATDPDREGEAISWHVLEELKKRKALPEGIGIKRVVFNEITKTAVTEAIKNPKEISQNMVDAYLARRALDYLVGFTLSPVLWRKLPGSKSAGRVQSVALKLISERESDIEAFRPEEYWTVESDFQTDDTKKLTARLTHLDSTKLDKFSLNTEKLALDAVQKIEAQDFAIDTIQRKAVKRNPYAPFITSTLQQDASRKLGFGASRTMQVAQKLYEAGHITYMRTDSITMSKEAVFAARDLIGAKYGAEYVPSSPRMFKSKSKNAQEGHEAIRPTNLSRFPEQMGTLEADLKKLYTLIWKRAVASQMAQAVFDQTVIEILSGDKAITFRAVGTIMKFDGFLTLYQESKDDDEKSKENKRLPNVNEGQKLGQNLVVPEQHFTQPPPRFTEASLVKKLEELGIGRPSTYASIIKVLQDRDYVRLESKRFIPEDRGRIVTVFLEKFFAQYVEYGFTAALEDKLDDIANGDAGWQALLSEFWGPFKETTEGAKALSITEVIDLLDERLEVHFFPVTEENATPRKCPKCDDGRLGLKLGRTGGFVGCSNYPDCKYTRTLSASADVAGGGEDYPKVLGQSKEGIEITLRKGPYGVYVQLGEEVEKKKPKRVALPRGQAPENVTLEMAQDLLSLPRAIGVYAETGEEITAAIGRFGPYLKIGSRFVSLKAPDDVLSVTLVRATEVIDAAPKPKPPLRVIGKHPTLKGDVQIMDGKYGPYISCGRTRAPLGKDVEVDAITLEEAVKKLAAKKGGAKAKAKPKAKAKTKAKAKPKAKPKAKATKK